MYDIFSSQKSAQSRKPLSITLVQSNRGKKERIQKFKNWQMPSKMQYFQIPSAPLANHASKKISRRPRTAISRRIIVLGRYNKPNFTGSGYTVASVIEYTGHLTEMGRGDAPFNARAFAPNLCAVPCSLIRIKLILRRNELKGFAIGHVVYGRWWP